MAADSTNNTPTSEQAQEVLDRLNKGMATDEDYAFVTRVSMAALQNPDILTKSADGASEKDDDDEATDDAAASTDAASSEDGKGDDDDASTASDEAAEDEAMGKSADSILDPETQEPLWKSMVEAVEEAGAENGEEYLDGEVVLKSIATGMDTILAEVRAARAEVGALVGRVGKLEKSMTATAGAAAPAETKTATEEAAIDPLKKSADQATATQLQALLGRIGNLEEALNGRPQSPHPSGNTAARLGKSFGMTDAPQLTRAQSEEIALDAIQKSVDSGLVSTDHGAAACNAIGERRDLEPAEIIRRIAPGALPELKAMTEARL